MSSHHLSRVNGAADRLKDMGARMCGG